MNSTNNPLGRHQTRGRRGWISQAIAPLFATVFAIASGSVLPTSAAERLTLRLGPWSGTIAISDLEEYAKTGKLSGQLEPLSPLFPPGLREVLSQRVEIDPEMTDEVIDKLFESPEGNRLLRTLLLLVPESTIEEMKAAIALVASKGNGLSFLGILKALPGETITLDATSIIGVASRLNLSYLEGQILKTRLETALEVETDPFYPSFDPAAKGPQTVSAQTLTLEDTQRNREIAVEIYSSPNSSGPLAVMSHGFASDRFFLEYLARHLASHGLTVVSVEHPGSNEAWLQQLPVTLDPTDLIEAEEFLHRPRDIRFVLDELEALNRQPGTFYNQFNTAETVAIGHSLGGYGILALAGAEVDLPHLREVCQKQRKLGQSPADLLQCAAGKLEGNRVNLRDRRIKSAIALNPMVGDLFGPQGLEKVQTPVLLLSGSDDSWAPAIDHQLAPFRQLPEPKYLVSAIGGNHFSASDPDNPTLVETQTTLPEDPSDAETQNLRQLVRGVSLAFIKQNTPEAKTYAPFLTAAYAQSLSTEEIALRLNRELPDRLARWIESREEISQRD
ncbi:alpha/beta hydrolase [Phormidium sp. CCY1219]|uniref:alpha/beta hydrolase n=1 Tax=Phormidium sp. CCY1219 TaxID=2886104 RepID=UPI002D1E5376|nr:alpha/beta fold hydrolase [Phormidium sp. CCY1219]MEB3826053.1 alpha/beta hydrolase [Phormidium sp. CCY1219]